MFGAIRCLGGRCWFFFRGMSKFKKTSHIFSHGSFCLESFFQCLISWWREKKCKSSRFFCPLFHEMRIRIVTPALEQNFATKSKVLTESPENCFSAPPVSEDLKLKVQSFGINLHQVVVFSLLRSFINNNLFFVI